MEHNHAHMKPYTYEEDALILSSPNSASAVGKALGRTKRAILSRRYDLRRKMSDAGVEPRRIPNWSGRQRHMCTWTAKELEAVIGPRTSPKHFTPDEDDVVMRTDLSAKEAARLLGRDVQSIRHRRDKIRKDMRDANVPEDDIPYFDQINRSVERAKKPWTPHEIQLITTSNMSDEELASELGRTTRAIHAKRTAAHANGITPIHYWTAEDDALVMSANMSLQELSTLLGRTKKAVLARQRRLRGYNVRTVRKWRPEEIELLANTTMSNREIGQVLDRSTEAVSTMRARLRKNGVDVHNLKDATRGRADRIDAAASKDKRRRYTDEELVLLYDTSIPSYEVARLTKRTTQSVHVARNRRGIYLNGPVIPWTDEDDKVLMNTSLSHEKAAELLGRTVYAVRSRRARLTKKMDM